MPVSSYLAFPPLPVHKHRRYISVALSLGSPPAAVSRYPCPMEPGLSSGAAFRHCIRSCLSHSSKIILHFSHPVNICSPAASRRTRVRAGEPPVPVRVFALLRYALIIQTKHTLTAAASRCTQFATAFANAHSDYPNQPYADRGSEPLHPIRDRVR